MSFGIVVTSYLQLLLPLMLKTLELQDFENQQTLERSFQHYSLNQAGELWLSPMDSQPDLS